MTGQSPKPIAPPVKKNTYSSIGTAAGALGLTGAHLMNRSVLKTTPKIGLHRSIPANLIFGGILGNLVGGYIPKTAAAAAEVKENGLTMNNDLMNMCELVKQAADLSLPLEETPAPGAGSDAVQGMTNNATVNPAVAGSGVYADPSEELVLQKAREKALEVVEKAAAERSAATSNEYAQAAARSRLRGLGTWGTGLVSGALAAHNLMKGNPRVAAGFGTLAGLAGAADIANSLVGNYNAIQAARYAPEKTAASNLPVVLRDETIAAPKGYFSKAMEYARNHKKALGIGAGIAAGLGAAGIAAKKYKDYRDAEKTAAERSAATSNEYAQAAARSRLRGLGTWGTGLVSGALAAHNLMKGNPRVAAGFGTLAGLAGAADIANSLVGNYNAIQAARYAPEKTAADEYYNMKLASVQEYGVTPDEAYAAMDAAEALYEDSVEKIAYAQELYADACDYFDTLEKIAAGEQAAAAADPGMWAKMKNYAKDKGNAGLEFAGKHKKALGIGAAVAAGVAAGAVAAKKYKEKTAAEFAPIASSAVGSMAGATAGYMLGNRFNAPRLGAAVGGAIGSTIGGVAPSVLDHFAATTRE